MTNIDLSIFYGSASVVGEEKVEATMEMYACLDHACEDFHLCKFCYLVGNWRGKKHLPSHKMELSNVQDHCFANRTEHELHSTSLNLRFGQFSAYLDTVRDVLVVSRLNSVGVRYPFPSLFYSLAPC